ncbi:MAG TPA: hypothetical protein PKJ47_12770 [Candidatus Limiplasma sp.]|nr:hypothetical protein [Candidatus Limiplasma sp.]
MNSSCDNFDIVDHFEDLYRAVLPLPDFWHNDDYTVSSGALIDKRGLSTDRSYTRSEEECVSFLDSCKSRKGGVISFQVCNCLNLDIHTIYAPVDASENTPANPYHTVVVRSPHVFKLSDAQAHKLAKQLKIIRWGLFSDY